jgi:hypothetical protein
MDSKKYIGMDVHKESISIAIMNGAGKIVMECVIETKATMILQFFDGLRGDLQVTFEEGTSGRLVVRPVETVRDEIGGVRSAKECLQIGAGNSHTGFAQYCLSQGAERMLAGGVQFKDFLQHRCPLRINFDAARSGIVFVPESA